MENWKLNTRDLRFYRTLGNTKIAKFKVLTETVYNKWSKAAVMTNREVDKYRKRHLQLKYCAILDTFEIFAEMKKNRVATIIES